MTNHKPKRADMDVRSSEDRVIVTDPSGSAVRTTADVMGLLGGAE